MNTEERQVLRSALIAAGFHRYDYTNDYDGNGIYREFWADDSDNGVIHTTHVNILWGQKEGK
jgi:hypothetical protein